MFRNLSNPKKMKDKEIENIIDKWQDNNNYCFRDYEDKFILEIVKLCLDTHTP